MGLQDAHNLAWRLAAVLSGAAHPCLLEDYARERHEASRQIIQAAAENNRRRDLSFVWNAPQHALVYGQIASTGTFEKDPGTAPQPAYPFREYRPGSWPGGRAPHLWLDEDQGFSVLDLFGRKFILLVEDRTSAWATAGATLQHLRSDLLLAIMSEYPCACEAWTRLYAARAVLVRPDGIIAWRSFTEPVRGEAELQALMARLLHLAAVRSKDYPL
jgi:putative polyketide hydroxylase